MKKDQGVVKRAIVTPDKHAPIHDRAAINVVKQAIEIIKPDIYIDLGDLELDDFRFDTLVEFLQNNNFTFVLGLRNIDFEDNPTKGWTDKLKEILKSNDINYDEYIVDQWPLPVPEFDVPDNIFILRYSYDEYNKIDQFAAHQFLFQRFMKNSEWELYYKEQPSVEKDRIIVFISNIENLVLKDTFVK